MSDDVGICDAYGVNALADNYRMPSVGSADDEHLNSVEKLLADSGMHVHSPGPWL